MNRRTLFLVAFAIPVGALLAAPRTPLDRDLIKAIENDDPKPIIQYLDNGGDSSRVVETLNVDTGDTLLHHAAWHGSEKVARILLKRGADRMKLNRFNGFPIEEAIDSKHPVLVDLLKRPQVKLSKEKIRSLLLSRLVSESHLMVPGAKKEELPIVYIRVNGADPTKQELKLLQKMSRKIRPYSEIPFDPDVDRDNAKLARFTKFEVSLKIEKDLGAASWKHWTSGLFIGGTFENTHGYWIKAVKETIDYQG